MMNSEVIDHEDILVVRFRVGDTLFGIEAKLVIEVVKIGELTYVHDAPPEVMGIRNLRGHIVTVIDTSLHLGTNHKVISPDSRLLIMEKHGEFYGYLVDAVHDAQELITGSFEPPPPSLHPSLHDRIKGVWREGEHLTAILDPDAFFEWNN